MAIKNAQPGYACKNHLATVARNSMREGQQATLYRMMESVLDKKQSPRCFECGGRANFHIQWVC